MFQVLEQLNFDCRIGNPLASNVSQNEILVSYMRSVKTRGVKALAIALLLAEFDWPTIAIAISSLNFH